MSRRGERGSQLRARVDRELAVDAREVDLDGPLSDEEGLCDLAVGGAFSCHLGDAALAGRERLEAAFKHRKVKKTYLAVVHGWPPPSGTRVGAIGRDRKEGRIAVRQIRGRWSRKSRHAR